MSIQQASCGYELPCPTLRCFHGESRAAGTHFVSRTNTQMSSGFQDSTIRPSRKQSRPAHYSIQEENQMKKAENTVSATQDLPFAAFVGIDWADRKHLWCLQEAGSDQREGGELEHTPESVDIWAGQLCQRFPGRPIAVALEQSRGALVFLLSKFEQLHLYPVLP